MPPNQIIDEYGRLEQDLERLAQRVSASGLTYTDIFRGANPNRALKRIGAIISIVSAGVLFYHAASGGWLYRIGQTDSRPPQVSASDPGQPTDAVQDVMTPQVSLEKKLNDYVSTWKTAWETGVGYGDLYDPSFVSERGEALCDYLTRKQSYHSRRSGSIQVTNGNLRVTISESNITCIEFQQQYKSSEYSDTGMKELCISMKEGIPEKIFSETWRSR